MLTPGAQRAIAIVVLVAGLFVTVLGVLTMVHGRALESRGVVAEATLTATGHRQEDSDSGHQVKYRFSVGGRDYERVGVFGTSVWSDVEFAALQEATAKGTLPVRYLPDDPSINEPVGRPRPMGQKGWIAIVIGLLMIVAGVVRWMGAGSRRVEAQTSSGAAA